MKQRRSKFLTFNPEKFLEQEKKKVGLPVLPSLGMLLPIRFSNERRRAFIAKLVNESPCIFYHGRDEEGILAAITVLKEKIAEELSVVGIKDDRTLIGYLLADVIRDPAWKRAKREK